MSEQEFQSIVLQRLAQSDEFQTLVLKRLDNIETRLDHLETNQEKFNDKFSNYQQAVQWVVQLAFTLIGSATLTIIVSSVLRR